MSGIRTVVLTALLASATPTAGAAPGLSGFDADSVQALRAEHDGRPYVLALWSVHCEPCRSELPLLGELKARHPEIAVELVSTDYLEDQPAAAAMLTEFDLDGVRTWAFADDFVERIRYAIDPRWRGELPRTYLYDAEHGATAISGRLDEAALEAWLGEAMR